MEKLVIFDIDGTLHKTEVMSTGAYRDVMTKLGLPVPGLETLKLTYGLGTQAIHELLGIPFETVEKWKTLFSKYEKKHIARSAVAYDGAIEALEQLSKSGVRLALCSLCTDEYMKAIVDKFRIRHLIRYTRNESVSDNKSELVRQLLIESAADRAVMVGDRIFDIWAAKANGVASVGCLYGYGSEEVLDATRTVESAWQIPETVRQLLMEAQPKEKPRQCCLA